MHEAGSLSAASIGAQPADCAAVSREPCSAVCQTPPIPAVGELTPEKAKTLATLEHLMHAAVLRGDLEAGRRYWREIGTLLGSGDANA